MTVIRVELTKFKFVFCKNVLRSTFNVTSIYCQSIEGSGMRMLVMIWLCPSVMASPDSQVLRPRVRHRSLYCVFIRRAVTIPITSQTQERYHDYFQNNYPVRGSQHLPVHVDHKIITCKECKLLITILQVKGQAGGFPQRIMTKIKVF